MSALTVTSARAASTEEAAPPIAAVDGEGPALRAPGAVLMSVGTVASGLLAYAFNAVAARALGPDAYGPIAVLWAAMCLVAVIMFRPLEQTLSRAVAERLAAGRDARPVVRTVAFLVAGAVAVAAAACAAAWGTLTDRLFDGQSLLTAMLVVGIAGYGASYFMRGLVGGQRWYAAYGQLLLIDGGVRLLLVLPLLVWASSSLAAVATAAAAIAGAFGPWLAPGRRERARLDGRGSGAEVAGETAPGDAEAEGFHAARAARFAIPAAVLAAGDQVLLNGGPVLVVLHGGDGAATAAGVVFAATMLVRAPAFLFQGVSAALLPNLTTMLVRGDGHGFRRAVTKLTLVLLAFAAAITVVAFAVGPWGMHLFYGDGFDATRTELALLGAGAGGYLVAATLSQAALARSEAVSAAAIWAVSALLFVALELVIGGEPLFRVALAFCLAAFANAGAFWALSLVRRTGARTAPALHLAPAGADQ